MKSDWRDFVLSGSFIGLILAASLSLVWLACGWTRRWLGDYHVLADAAMVFITYGIGSAIVVRALLYVKPMVPGEYALDAPTFTYWKLLTVLYRLGQGALAWLVPVFAKPLLDALFGARIGANAAFGGTIDDPYMVRIGDGVVLGNASLVSGNYLSGGKLNCGPVTVGSRVTVGANSVILPNTSIGEGAVLMGGSYVMPGTTIPAGEVWRGNPARKWM